MCEFCIKHGEGKRWYLQAKNYSEDMLSDTRRRKLIEEFVKDPAAAARQVKKLRALERTPRVVSSAVRRLITSSMKKTHFGQVVPIEEIERIFECINSVVRVSCFCRHAIGKKEQRYCYGLSISPNGGELKKLLSGLDQSFLNGPDSSGYEVLSKQEALAKMRQHESEGLCHTIWTFYTPFICAICNCSRADCLAMRCTVDHQAPVMFRSEYQAAIDEAACIGCEDCLSFCQFSALQFNPLSSKMEINQQNCYGCGVCRTGCEQGAITLSEK